jgi:arabinofuranan 3-O-arabinosyltransferase
MIGNVVKNRGTGNAVRRFLGANPARWSFGTVAGHDRTSSCLPDVHVPWRLQVAGYTLAAVYAALFFFMYKTGNWLVDSAGGPVMIDFTYFWIEGSQALHGNIAALYDPAKLTHIVAAVVGADHANVKHFFYPNSPNPPILFLVLAPLAMLSFVPAWMTWEVLTFVGCVAVVFLIVRHPTAIALVLASPFSAYEIYWGQTGFLRASLLGAALLTLERRPLLAGVFIGCLTYKPQFGIVIPVALVAAGQWRALTSAAITALALVGASTAAFGIGPWEAFPHALHMQADLMLLHKIPGASPTSAAQTVYGLVRMFHGSAAVAWLAQGCATAGIAVIVWLVWRSPARYALKAALLSAATLVATPYAWAHDFSVIVIPIAFLAADLMRCGLLRGEQRILMALFGLAFVDVVCEGVLPLGPLIMFALVGIILHRILHDDSAPINFLVRSRLNGYRTE